MPNNKPTHSDDELLKLRLQHVECEDAILALMKDNRGNDYMFVRGVLEKLIEKIETRIAHLKKELEALK